MASFFEATSPFGDLTGWEVQTGGGVTTKKTRASALGADGDEFRHVDHEQQNSVSAAYAAETTSGTLTIPSVGGLLNGYVVDSVEVSYTQDVPTMTVTGHNHTNKLTTAYTSMRTYSPSFDLPAVPLGVPAALGVVACEGARSATYKLSCTHIDEIGGQDTLVGADNHDGVETLEVESVQPITYTDSNGDWTPESNAANKTNNAATVNTLTLTKHIAHDSSGS